MAGLGFFAGGLADSMQAGNAQNSLDQYRMGELKLQQQAQQNAERRQQFAQIDKIRSDHMGVITDTIEQMKIAGKNEAEIAKAIQPLVQPLKKLDQSSGRDPSALDAQIAVALAKPADAAKTAAMTKPVKSGVNEFGTEQYQAFNPKTNKYEPTQPAAPAQSPASAPAEPSGQGGPGDQFLSTLPPQVREIVKGIGDYEIDPRTTSVKGGHREQLLNLVRQYNPNYDQKEFGARNAVVQQFSKGVEARTVRSFNVLVSHLDVLGEATRALNNGDIQGFNSLKNIISAATGNPEPTDFNGVKAIVGTELAKAIIGSGAGALGDREELKKDLAAANSERQLLSLINKYQKLAGGQLAGLRKQYEAGTGRKDFDKYLDQRTLRIFSEGSGQGGKDPSRVPGGKPSYKFNPDTGELE